MEFSHSQLSYREALAKAMDICGRSEKCRFDLELKCHDWRLTAEETAKLNDYLVQEKFIDHQRYATSFVNDKFRFNKWGKIKLAYALRQKRIEEQCIKDALSGLPEYEYQKVLSELLSAKAKTIKEKDGYTRNNKLIAFAQSHGFEVDLALKIVEGM